MGDVTEHFSYWEFRCRCGCGLDRISPVFVTRLESARRLFGRGITVTSGVRCPRWNAKVDGAPNSSHCWKGSGVVAAADLACIASATRYNLLMALLTVGFPRVGIGENFVHVDLDYTLPQDLIWIYPADKARW